MMPYRIYVRHCTLSCTQDVFYDETDNVTPTNTYPQYYAGGVVERWGS